MANPSLFLAGPMEIEPTPSGVTAEKKSFADYDFHNLRNAGCSFLGIFCTLSAPNFRTLQGV
jgi:hypothetical protein